MVLAVLASNSSCENARTTAPIVRYGGQSLRNLLIGVLAGEWIRTNRSGARKAAAVLAGAGLVLAGWLLHPWLPINKRIWTPTFALLSSGVSLVVFALLYVVVDLRRSRWWTAPALVFGSNAILAFVLSGVVTTLSNRIHTYAAGSGSLTLHKWGYQHLFARWLAPIHASLAYAIMIVLVNMLLILPLYRRRIFLRV